MGRKGRHLRIGWGWWIERQRDGGKRRRMECGGEGPTKVEAEKRLICSPTSPLGCDIAVTMVT